VCHNVLESGMAPLETRRLRENLTEVFKILKAIEDINGFTRSEIENIL